MSKTHSHPKHSPAAKLIEHLRESVLRVDAAWSVERENGFSWWPHQQRQDIFIDRHRTESDGTRLERVVVSTEIAKLGNPDSITHELVSTLARCATLSGMVCEDKSLRLHAHAWVEESNRPLYAMVLGLVAGLQIREAALIAVALDEAGLGEPSITRHPVSGLRDEPDEIASIVDTVIAPAGQQPTPWPEEMFDQLRETYLAGPPCLMANSGSTGLTAEFPFGTESSLVQAKTDQTHPLIGKGLWILNSFGLDEIPSKSGLHALLLNAWEIEHADQPFFGSWCEPEDGRVDFITFVPNLTTPPSVAGNSVILAAGRAQFMSVQWLNDDWSETWDEQGRCKARTALERVAAGEVGGKQDRP